ncbi:hypothetical protein PBAL39_16916 [Pedobacter sp. BAL39]|nr:hypothetical protein PBAL39_16916 [Pedobacter sp. BAL39]
MRNFAPELGLSCGLSCGPDQEVLLGSHDFPDRVSADFNNSA